MKSHYQLACALLTGAAVGGTAVGVLRAQPAPPTYAVLEVSNITDMEALRAIVPKAGQAVAAFGGRYIMRTNAITPADGLAPKRIVVIAFDSFAKARAWQASAAHRDLMATQAKATDYRLFFAEGEPP